MGSGHSSRDVPQTYALGNFPTPIFSRTIPRDIPAGTFSLPVVSLPAERHSQLFTEGTLYEGQGAPAVGSKSSGGDILNPQLLLLVVAVLAVFDEDSIHVEAFTESGINSHSS